MLIKIFSTNLETVGLLFFIFSFYGWLLELWLEILAGRKPVNRGFLKGPCIPIYGIGVIMGYAVAHQIKDHPVLVFFVLAALFTLVEYVTAAFLEKYLKLKAWDYSLHLFAKWCHYKGRVSLTASVLSGAFAMGIVYFYWDFQISLLDLLPRRILIGLDIFFTLAFIVDFVFSTQKYILNKKVGIINKSPGVI